MDKVLTSIDQNVPSVHQASFQEKAHKQFKKYQIKPHQKTGN